MLVPILETREGHGYSGGIGAGAWCSKRRNDRSRRRSVGERGKSRKAGSMKVALDASRYLTVTT